MGKNCDHSMGGTWGSWFYLEGVTSGIMMRIKTCNGCGATIDQEVKEA